MSKKLEWVANDFANPNYQPIPKAGGGHLSVKEQVEWRSRFIEG
jgi:hypothetical protein